MSLTRIAIFASGNGSNAQRIAEYFANDTAVEIAAVYCNNPGAYVLSRAEQLHIPSVLFDRQAFGDQGRLLQDLLSRRIHWIVLAGFLWLIPTDILKHYERRIINIHPALLPRYGGRGMYGQRVHEAVIAAGEHQSGITIHYVNEKYDDGGIIFQATCAVEPADTPETLAARIHQLEYEHYPVVIGQLIRGEIS